MTDDMPPPPAGMIYDDTDEVIEARSAIVSAALKSIATLGPQLDHRDPTDEEILAVEAVELEIDEAAIALVSAMVKSAKQRGPEVPS